MNNESINFLNSTLPVTVCAVYVDTNKTLRDIHFHNAIELVSVDRGSIQCTIGEETFAVNENEILFINRKVIHRLFCDSGSAQFTYVQIEIDRFFPAVTDISSLSAYSFIHSNNLLRYKTFASDSDIGNTFRDIVREYTSQKKHFESYITADIYRIGAIMKRCELFPNESALDKKQVSKLMPAIEYAKQHYSERIYLEDVCALMNMDRFYFCKLFKKTVGAPYINYINFLRLEYAEQMLISTNKNISEIAYDCGFASVQYFNKLFKRKNDCLPTTYRKLMLK